MLAFENIILLLSAILILVVRIKMSNPLYIILVVLIANALHFISGSPRWQFIPLYGIFFFAVFSLLPTTNHIWTKRVFVVLGVICILLSQLFNYLLPVFSISTTRGVYKISALSQDLDDNLHYKIWFPINSKSKTDVKTSYYKNQHGQSIMGMPKFLLNHLKHVKTNAFQEGEIIKKPFPLIIYSHGASSILVDNTTLMEEIASHGYVVVALQHDFRFEKYGIDIHDAKKVDAEIQMRLIDNLLQYAVPEQTEDYKRLLTSIQKLPFAMYVDFSNIGLVGHSLGGATVTSVPTIIKNIKAIVNIDGPISKSDLKKYETSFLYISSFSPDLSDRELENFKVLPSFYRAVKNYELQNVKDFLEINSCNSSWVRFKTANHLDLTDMPFVMPILTSKNYNKQEGALLKGEIVVAFLNKNLKNKVQTQQIENKNIEWIKEF